MRLSQKEIEIITATIAEKMPEGVQVKLFGSRLDDFDKGGDIDLLVKTSKPVERPAWLIAKLQASLMMKLGEQKIDILLEAPNLKKHEIHQIADAKGIRL